MMMFLLIRDVLLNRRPRGGAYGECRIALLPGKRSQADLLMHPCRGSLFQLTHDVRQTMSRFQADQKVDVIVDTADALRNSTKAEMVPPRYSCRRERHSGAMTASRLFVANTRW